MEFEQETPCDVNLVIAASHQLEEAGSFVLAYSVVLSACQRLRDTILPQERVRLRIRAADLLQAYTNNHEEARSHLTSAIHHLEGQSSSVKFNSLRVAIHLRLAESHARTDQDLVSAWRDVESAKKVAEESKLSEMLPRVHLARFHLFVLAFDMRSAHSALEKAEELSSGGIAPQLHILCRLLRAHVHLRDGQLESARILLDKLESELRSDSMKHTNAPPPKGEFAMLELEEYRLLLVVLHAICAGDLSSLERRLKAWCEAIERKRRAAAAAGDRGLSSETLNRRLLCWWSDAVCEALFYYAKSLHVQGRWAAQAGGGGDAGGDGAQKEAGRESVRRAVDAAHKGLRALARAEAPDPAAAGEAEAAGGGRPSPSPDEIVATVEGVRPAAFGYEEAKVRYVMGVLLYERLATICLQQTDLSAGLASIEDMILCVDRYRGTCGGDGALDLTGSEIEAAVHSAIAQYLRRVGDVDGAQLHLQQVDASAATEKSKAAAKLHRALILLDSPDAAERTAREASALCEEAWKVLGPKDGVEGGGAGEDGYRCLLSYLRARILLKFRAEEPDQVEEATRLAEAALEDAVRLGPDRVCQVELVALLGDAQLAQDNVNEGLKRLGEAHLLVQGLGDLWLEMGILRNLERGYLKLSERGRVARASSTIQASRGRALEARKRGALDSPAHPRVAGWRLPVQGSAT